MQTDEYTQEMICSNEGWTEREPKTDGVVVTEFTYV